MLSSVCHIIYRDLMKSKQSNGSSLDNAAVDVTPTTKAYNGCVDVTEYNESENNDQSNQTTIIKILDFLMKDNSYLMYDIIT